MTLNQSDIDKGTVLGIPIPHIAVIIAWFREHGFSPYKWEEFKVELTRRRPQ